MSLLRFSTLGAAALALSPLRVDAQSACNLDFKGSELKKAQFAVVSAAAGGRPEARTSALRGAVKAITEKPLNIKDPLARDLLLGQIMVLHFAQLNAAPTVSRGEVGFISDTDARIDLVVAADSLFDIVEATKPECTAETDEYRKSMSQILYKKAVDHYNASAFDSSVAVLNRTMIIDSQSPDIPNVLAVIAQKRGDYDTAIREYEKVIALSGSDTSSASMRTGARTTVSELLLFQAGKLEGPARAALMKRSSDHLRASLKEDPENVTAKARLAGALIGAGDTVAASVLFAELVANSSKLSDIQLFEAGVAAARANRNAEATKLFEAGLVQNPYLRDGLYNAAIMYVAQEDSDKLLNASTRLVEVDPNNEDNWRLLASVYHLRQKNAKDAKVKRAMTDSLVKYMGRATSLPAQVSFTSFNHDGTKHSLAGRLENRGKTSKSFTLKFEFLDKAGKAVATQEATVGPVAAGEAKTFTVSVEQPGVVAFRYMPIT